MLIYCTSCAPHTSIPRTNGKYRTNPTQLGGVAGLFCKRAHGIDLAVQFATANLSNLSDLRGFIYVELNWPTNIKHGKTLCEIRIEQN